MTNIPNIINHAIITGRICAYCNKPTKLVDSQVVYSRSYGPIYYCHECQAWVGTHKDSNRALGRVANKELREWKKKAHSVFDPLWRKKMDQGYNKHEARSGAYEWLSKEMGTLKEYTHIGMFDVEQCKKVVELCKKYLK